MRPLLPLAIASLALALTACGSDEAGATFTSEPAESSALEDAYDTCTDPDNPLALETTADLSEALSLSSDGKSLIVTSPKFIGRTKDAAAGLTAARCVLSGSDAPETIAQNMGTTTPLMGRQSDSYDGINVQWTYSGLQAGSSGFTATFADTK